MYQSIVRKTENTSVSNRSFKQREFNTNLGLMGVGRDGRKKEKKQGSLRSKKEKE